MLVTHRGPYRFSVQDDGSFASTRGAGGIVERAAAARRATNDTGERQAWVAAAIDDGDRAAIAAGAVEVPGLDLHLLDLDPASAPHALRRDLERGAVVPAPRAVRPRPPAPLRPPPPRRVGRLRRGERRVRRRASPTTPRTASGCSCTTTSSPWSPAWCGRTAPTCRSRTSPTRPFCGPNSIRVLPDRHGRGAVRVDGCGAERVPHRAVGTRLRGVGDRGARAAPPIEPYATPLGPDPAALAALAASPDGQRAPPLELDELVGRPQAGAAQRPHRPVEEHRARLPRVRRAPRHPPRMARPRRVRRHAQPVAREPRRVPRLRAGGRPGRGAGERALGHRRLAAGRRRHARRLRADHRRLHPLRRPAGEPGEGRPEPRGQGRPAAQPPRRRGACSHRRRVRTRSSPTRCSPSIPYDIEQGAARAAHRARRCPTTNAPRARRGCASSPTVHTPQSWLDELLNQARAERVGRATSSSFRQAGRTVDHDVGPAHLGRALGRRHADAHRRGASTPSRSSACSAAKAGRSPASSPANAATDAPRASSATVVPLSTGTGGRSSTAIRPAQRCLEPQARRRLVGPRQRLGPAVGLGRASGW